MLLARAKVVGSCCVPSSAESDPAKSGEGIRRSPPGKVTCPRQAASAKIRNEAPSGPSTHCLAGDNGRTKCSRYHCANLGDVHSFGGVMDGSERLASR